MVSKKTLSLNRVTLLSQKKTLESKRIIITRIEKRRHHLYTLRTGLFSFGFLYNILEYFLPMVKNPPRALFSLKTQHSVGIQINKLNIYKHLSRALSLFQWFT